MRGDRDELAQQHRQAAVAGDRNHLPAGVGQLGADRVRQRVGHGPVQVRADQPAGAQRVDVPGGPDIAHAGVRRENRVPRRHLVQQRGRVFRVDRLFRPDVAGVRPHGLVHEPVVLLEHRIEETAALLGREQRHEGGKGGEDVAVHCDVDVGPPPQFVRGPVHLRRPGSGEELVVREVGAQQDQQVRVLDALGRGAVTQQPGHADVVGVVVLHEVLAAEAVADRRRDQPGERNHLVVRALDAGTGKDGHLAGGVDGVGQFLHTRGVRHQRRRPEGRRGRRFGRRLQAGDVTGKGHDGDAPETDGVLDGAVHDAGRLLRGADQLGVDRALVEEPVRVGFLEETAADLLAGDVRGDGQHRRPGAVGVVQAVDQVQVAGPAGAGAHREPAGQLGFRRRGEGGRLLMPDMDPVNTALSASRRSCGRRRQSG